MRPHVFVNVAMSADGKISTGERRQVRISGEEDRLRVDAMRASSDGIMVGIGTVLADNPSLTVKSEDLRRRRVAEGRDENPVRIVVDSRGRTPTGADILHRGSGKRIIAVSRAVPESRLQALGEHAEVIVAGESEVDLKMLMEELWRRGIRRLMVEGGGTLIYSLFASGLVDEFSTFVGNVVIGGASSPTPADGQGFFSEREFVRLELQGVVPMDRGVLIHWKITSP